MGGAPTFLTKERAPLSKIELVGLVASVMAMTALTIDMMLAALGDIGADFGLANENDRQLVVVAFLLGSGAAQLFYGPLADRFGRRAVFIWSIVGFLAATLLCVVASAYSFFIAGRTLQGVAAAAGRVVAIALVRDLFKGREMASIMSMAMTVSIVSPIIAPSLGQLILFVAPWRSVYKIVLMTDTDVTFLLTSGGHNAGIVTPPGHPRRIYQVGLLHDHQGYVDPDRWREASPVHKGSWWPEWQTWISDFANGKVPARQPGDGKLKVIEDAPGSYVRVQAQD